jgi:homeobox protein cut-like
MREFCSQYSEYALFELQVSHSELESSLQAISEEVIHTRAELEKQTALNEKLENDLLLINQRVSNGASAKDESTANGQDGLSGLKLGQKSVVHAYLHLPF